MKLLSEAQASMSVPSTVKCSEPRRSPGSCSRRSRCTEFLEAWPGITEAIEIVGCPTCHTDNANFVQTNVDRTFSPFYELELDARGARLDGMHVGNEVPVPPFGPLQVVE